MGRRKQKTDAKGGMIFPHSPKDARLSKNLLLNWEADICRSSIQRSEAGIGALKSAVSLAWDSEGFYFQTHVSTVPRCLHDSLRHDFDWPFALHQPFFGCGSDFICRPMVLGRPLSNGYPSTIQFDRRSRPPSRFTFLIPLNLMIRRNCFISSLLLSLQGPCQ